MKSMVNERITLDVTLGLTVYPRLLDEGLIKFELSFEAHMSDILQQNFNWACRGDKFEFKNGVTIDTQLF